MKIGTIGAGRMVEALGGRWVRAGHEVMIGARNPQSAKEVADRIGAAGSGSLSEAAEFGDVVLFGVKKDAVESALEAAGAREGSLSGKVVIDCGNAVNTADFSLMTWEGKSFAEHAEAIATGSRVVKAFNLAAYTVWELDPVSYDGRPLAVPFCGEDAAKKLVEPLITDLGASALDIGDLRQARHLEAMGVVIVKMLFTGHGLNSVFQFIEAAPA
ncbi:NAD(P)-binding domain-containing protein [Nocardia sp. NEAU-G5]|uniref:NAD(P)-binding domain-containing protein n=1 Tax=Nocardia albiluteola TaxID=2842303 RepID=A0ABS6B1D5_9NOCA|nr:NAD(P)-binding domain-containing protein [Nocardia albiluteola]MBU3064112.1 NAD(P)-binding domain-containing protein [Nocardia albiluteola]